MHWTVHLGATSGLSVSLVLRLRNPDVVPYSHLIPCLRTLFKVPCSVHLLAWLSASVCMRNTFILPSALIPSPDTEFLLEIFLSIKFFFFFPPLFPCSHFFQREMCNHPFLCSFIQYVSLFLDCFYYFAVVLILSNVECDLMFSSCSCALKLLTWYPWAWRIYQFGNLLVIKSSNNFLSPLLLWELQLQVYWAAWSLPTAHPSSECFLLRYTATHRFSFFYCYLPVHKSFLQQYVTCR